MTYRPKPAKASSNGNGNAFAVIVARMVLGFLALCLVGALACVWVYPVPEKESPFRVAFVVTQALSALAAMMCCVGAIGWGLSRLVHMATQPIPKVPKKSQRPTTF